MLQPNFVRASSTAALASQLMGAASWNLAPRLPAMIYEGRALEFIARSALAPQWFVVEHVCRPDNILPERVFFDNPSQ